MKKNTISFSASLFFLGIGIDGCVPQRQIPGTLVKRDLNGTASAIITIAETKKKSTCLPIPGRDFCQVAGIALGIKRRKKLPCLVKWNNSRTG